MILKAIKFQTLFFFFLLILILASPYFNRDALLDKFGSVAVDGTYSSPIKNATSRFAAMIGALIGGRVSLTGTSLEVAKLGLTIAIRYAIERTQFGPPKQAEIPIMDYLSHQRRLFPLLARTYALSTGERYVRSLLANTTDTKHVSTAAIFDILY